MTNNLDADSLLKGTTLRVYIMLMKSKVSLGPREIQKSLGLSSHSVAVFHLEKLEKNGLASKVESDGTYVVNHVYLKNYFLLRRHLIPRYFFYALLSAAMAFGWLLVLFTLEILNPTVVSFDRQTILFLFIYGMLSSLLISGILWYETMNILKKEKI